MPIIHRLVGYDRQTDRMRTRFDIPDHLMPDAKKIAKVPADDPDAAWSDSWRSRRYGPGAVERKPVPGRTRLR